MGFAERADEQVTRRKSGVRNYVDQVLATMPADDAVHARRLLEGPKSDSLVASDFTAEGYPVGEGSVRNWRIANRVGRFA